MTQSYGSTYARDPRPVEALGQNARATFITRTYTHLFAAVLGFVAVEYFFFTTGLAEVMARAMLGTNWLLVLGGFILVNWLATRTATRSVSLGAQYMALAAFVVAEAVIFVPMLYIAQLYSGGGVIESAATVTLLGFGGLTMIAFWTRRDFSFLGALLGWVGLLALVAIVAAVLFGFELGTWFSVGMIGLAGAAILYDTSNVIHHYPEDRYVAAACGNSAWVESYHEARRAGCLAKTGTEKDPHREILRPRERAAHTLGGDHGASRPACYKITASPTCKILPASDSGIFVFVVRR